MVYINFYNRVDYHSTCLHYLLSQKVLTVYRTTTRTGRNFGAGDKTRGGEEEVKMKHYSTWRLLKKGFAFVEFRATEIAITTNEIE
jgi:hypothetical protein